MVVDYVISLQQEVLIRIYDASILQIFRCTKTEINRYMSISRTHGAEPFLRSRQLCSYSRTSQHFMEPEGSLPCSQKPYTGPYPQQNQSDLYHPILSL
jgi:hypothetical protein